MIPHRQIIENVGFADISSNFHEFGETPGARSHGFGKAVKPTFSVVDHGKEWSYLFPTVPMNSEHSGA